MFLNRNKLPEDAKVGFTCSTFDLFHAGHIVMLQEAKSKCDYLICGLLIDPTVDRPDTKNKPIQSPFERYVQLSSCRYVDEVIPYDSEASLIDLLESTPIDVRFIGEDYKDKTFTGDYLPIKVYYTNRKHSFSSSGLRRRVTQSWI